MKRMIVIMFILILSCIYSKASAQEELTLTTYYPAPYGEYSTLSVGDAYTAPDPTTGVDLLVEGAISHDDDNKFYGPNAATHVNLGIESSTGINGEDWKYCTISGGYDNQVQSQNSVVSGGVANKILGHSHHCVIGGGYQNSITGGMVSVIGGGSQNTTNSERSVISGGQTNKIGNSGYANTICGGGHNSVNDNSRYSIICGGEYNQVTGDSSFAGGQHMVANADNVFIWGHSNNDIQANAADTFVLPTSRVGIGTNAPDGAASLDVAGPIRSSGAVNGNPNDAAIIYGTPGRSNDGFSIRFVEDFFPWSGGTCDALVFEKTDANNAIPDDGGAGIAFVNTGTGGSKTAMAVMGDGNVGIGRAASRIERLTVKASGNNPDVQGALASSDATNNTYEGAHGFCSEAYTFSGVPCQGTCRGELGLRTYDPSETLYKFYGLNSWSNIVAGGMTLANPSCSLSFSQAQVASGIIGSAGVLAMQGVQDGAGIDTNHWAGHFVGKLLVHDGGGAYTTGIWIYRGTSPVWSAPDYVFEPGYELESIEEHAEFMFRQKRLKAIPELVEKDGKYGFELTQQNNGILEELEKAHIYIAQLNEKIKQLESNINKD